MLRSALKLRSMGELVSQLWSGGRGCTGGARQWLAGRVRARRPRHPLFAFVRFHVRSIVSRAVLIRWLASFERGAPRDAVSTQQESMRRGSRDK
jgi:hypothetical protein